MITLRCTAKTLKRFNMTAEDPLGASSRVLGDWYVNLLNLGRQRLVLCVAEHSLLPVILPARNSEFPGRLPFYIERMLRGIRIPEAVAAAEARLASEVRIGKTQNRSILGVMRDYKYMAEHRPPDWPPFDLALQLAETPFSPLKFESPDRVTRMLFGSARLNGGPAL
jgi:hypothetical protein